MNRLSQLTDSQRTRLGAAGLIVGTLLLVVGIVVAHYAGFPSSEVVGGETVPVDVDTLGWIPRGWQWVTLAQAVAFAGSQLILGGAVLLWVLHRDMTWVRASFAAWLLWIELVLLFGVVPSEWLNLTQGPLGMTRQRVAFAIPSWLVLGNEVELSFATIKDAVSGAYNTIMLGVVIVFAYKVQAIARKPVIAEPVVRTSPYGRPLVKGSD